MNKKDEQTFYRVKYLTGDMAGKIVRFSTEGEAKRELIFLYDQGICATVLTPHYVIQN